MTYQETLDYLFSSLPMFQRVGAAAYKEGLDRTIALDNYFGNPHTKYKTIHVAGTNGKGSVSTALASILAEAGYKVGLYTSPHLKDFRERIRVNGSDITEEEVVNFVQSHKKILEDIQPSFFEMTSAMAFDWFAHEKVDIAVIEVGMGGRLDSTNIITPILSVITNIAYDHTQFLGDTIGKIAGEKAGIIKRGVPVVVGETDPESMPVFVMSAAENDSPIVFADQRYMGESITNRQITLRSLMDGYEFTMQTGLSGNYQLKNIPTVITATEILADRGIILTRHNIETGLEKAYIPGRWQKLNDKPLTVCDTGHNEAGIRYAAEQIADQQYDKLFMVFGVVEDKDLGKILPLLPKDAHYIFTRADLARAMKSDILAEKAAEYGLRGECVEGVNAALIRAKELASGSDMIFVGGSIFVVAEVL